MGKGGWWQGGWSGRTRASTRETGARGCGTGGGCTGTVWNASLRGGGAGAGAGAGAGGGGGLGGGGTGGTGGGGWRYVDRGGPGGGEYEGEWAAFNCATHMHGKGTARWLSASGHVTRVFEGELRRNCPINGTLKTFAGGIERVQRVRYSGQTYIWDPRLQPSHTQVTTAQPRWSCCLPSQKLGGFSPSLLRLSRSMTLARSIPGCDEECEGREGRVIGRRGCVRGSRRSLCKSGLGCMRESEMTAGMWRPGGLRCAMPCFATVLQPTASSAVCLLCSWHPR
eukprot:877371-Rhodomonas_salina.2